MEIIAVVPLAGTWIEIINSDLQNSFNSVVPLAGTWIEINCRTRKRLYRNVVPLAGTWIEITKSSLQIKSQAEINEL